MNTLKLSPEKTQLYAQLLIDAKAGRLPRGPVSLRSGLVMNLAEYVIAWAEPWEQGRLGDTRHIFMRLDEALIALGRL